MYTRTLMAPYQSWLKLWQQSLRMPLSGDVMPVTSWFSPQLEFNFAGDHDIETQVVSDVASYGKQLGILSEAVLEIAHGKPDQAVERLQQLTEQVAQVKQQHQQALKTDLRRQLKQLQSQDPAALEELIQEFST